MSSVLLLTANQHAHCWLTDGSAVRLQNASGTIALVGTLAYVLSFALGAGAVPGVLVSEINPAAIRGERTQSNACQFGKFLMV